MDEPHVGRARGGERIANKMLALRHVEDARMRIGKILQYARDGVSIFDTPGAEVRVAATIEANAGKTT